MEIIIMDFEQLHEWVGHNILTQNFKTLGSWVISLIKCLTSTILYPMWDSTHPWKYEIPTIYLPLKCEPIHNLWACFPSNESFFIHTLALPLWHSTTHVVWPPFSIRLSTQGVSRTLRQTIGSDTIIWSWGGLKIITFDLEQLHKCVGHRILT
jgi:hypothetical protein